MKTITKIIIKSCILIFSIILVSISIIYVSLRFNSVCEKNFTHSPRFLFNETSNYDALQIILTYSNKGYFYTLTVFGNNNSVQFRRDMPKHEDGDYLITQNRLKEIIEQFKTDKFNYMKEQYYCSQILDAGSYQITFKYNNKTNSVEAYDHDGPKEFYDLKEIMLNLLNGTK
jgi:hypothetical protein